MSHKKRSHRQLAARRPHWLESPGRSEAHVRPQLRRPHADRPLEAIALPPGIDVTPFPADIAARIRHAQERIQCFQDRWDQPQIEQFVASDFELVFRVLRWVVQERMLSGQRLLEWGCGFAVVSALGSCLGLDVTGIEAESRLLEEAQRTIDEFAAPVELVWGNFLPRGAESLSQDPDFPSLGHRVPCGYQQIGSDLDDFSLVFGYPWPGEWAFHEAVFARYGAPGALLTLFCGPNDVRLWRKVV